MQTIYTSNNSRHDDKLSILSRIANSAIIIAVSIALLHSTTVLAGSAIKNTDQQIAQNVEEYNSKVSINQSDMTAKMKSKTLSKDNKIGAFSMEDEAREGFYGDGEYAD